MYNDDERDFEEEAWQRADMEAEAEAEMWAEIQEQDRQMILDAEVDRDNAMTEYRAYTLSELD